MEETEYCRVIRNWSCAITGLPFLRMLSKVFNLSFQFMKLDFIFFCLCICSLVAKIFSLTFEKVLPAFYQQMFFVGVDSGVLKQCGEGVYYPDNLFA